MSSSNTAAEITCASLVFKATQSSKSSISVTEQVSSLLSTKLGLKVAKEDIDVAHRLGKFNRDKARPVIVKFVRRQTKSDVMRNAKLLKGSVSFLNEDLTKLSAEVLASVRLKDPENLERAWSFEGKLYARYRGKNHSDRIDYEHFQT
ncbi:hypothetical protein DPMN_111193 [Dreissena polymorpha]|uniref:Uncharacterized protein n=1 Tax=Dreissena polymorpha TaxID=45954 RepID=A0A9D4KEE9_DREPO|nr:hypothetical protein DPMN_111193 [Dreissena polymorpha]